MRGHCTQGHPSHGSFLRHMSTPGFCYIFYLSEQRELGKSEVVRKIEGKKKERSKGGINTEKKDGKRGKERIKKKNERWKERKKERINKREGGMKDGKKE